MYLDGADVALGLVAGEPDGQVGGEPQDHVLVVAEAAGQPQPVLAGLRAAALVAGDALGHRAAVPGADLGQLIIAEAVLAGGAGGGGRGVRVDEQVGHGPGPDLAVWVPPVHIPQVAQAVGACELDPDGQIWARSMADLLIHANAKATAARAAGKPRLGDAALAQIRSWYQGAVAKGITDNQNRRGKTGKDGLRLARRFRDHQDMILRFTTDLAVGFTSNQAERDVRPVKVQMRTSGGCWRTLEGLADFAVVQSYLSTAAKWGIDQLNALTQLFTDGPWLPDAIRPG